MAASVTPELETIAPELRKKTFAGLLAAMVEQGYEIESQGDTEAVIVTRGRRRRFREPIAGKRQRISIDERGRKLSRGLGGR